MAHQSWKCQVGDRLSNQKDAWLHSYRLDPCLSMDHQRPMGQIADELHKLHSYRINRLPASPLIRACT